MKAGAGSGKKKRARAALGSGRARARRADEGEAAMRSRPGQVVMADWSGRAGGHVRCPDFCPAAAGGVFLGLGWKLPGIWTGCTNLYLEGARRLQIEHGFRPRDRDRTIETMEEV